MPITVELWTLPAPSFRKDLFSKLFETLYCCVRRTPEPESPELTGQRDAERTVSSAREEERQLIDIIAFDYAPYWKSKTFLEEKNVTEGRSIRQIAAQTLSSPAAIHDALIEAGISLRRQGKPGLRPAQVPYGYRRRDGLLFPHLGEQRAIASIRKMSSDGLSYRQICDFLTSAGVPTKKSRQTFVGILK